MQSSEQEPTTPTSPNSVELSDHPRNTKVKSISTDADDEIHKYQTSVIEAAIRDHLIRHNCLHYSLVTISILSPLLLQIAFLIATYQNGETPQGSAVSTGIGYHEGKGDVFAMVLTSSIISVIGSFFVSICRQIQISWVFEEFYNNGHITRAGWKAWRGLNAVAMCCNVLAHVGIVLLVRYDGFRYDGVNGPALHQMFAFPAVFFSGAFIMLTSAITFRQRNLEYRYHLKETTANKLEAFKASKYYCDACMLLVLLVFGIIGWVTYAVEFYTTNGYTTALGNTFEWMGFFALDSGPIVLALSFHLNRADQQIYDWWRRNLRPRWCMTPILTITQSIRGNNIP